MVKRSDAKKKCLKHLGSNYLFTATVFRYMKYFKTVNFKLFRKYEKNKQIVKKYQVQLKLT